MIPAYVQTGVGAESPIFSHLAAPPLPPPQSAPVAVVWLVKSPPPPIPLSRSHFLPVPIDTGEMESGWPDYPAAVKWLMGVDG